MSDAPKVLQEPKLEEVEYWTLIAANGQKVVYMIRVEIGEKGQVLKNPIDQTPVEVQLLFKSGDAKNEVVAVSSFPIANLFNYTCEKGQNAVYPEGHGPADQQLADIQHKQQDTLMRRKLAFEARIASISDLSEGDIEPLAKK